MSLYVPYYRPYNKHNTNIYASGGIQTHNPSKRAAEDPRLRPHGHWDRHTELLTTKMWDNNKISCGFRISEYGISDVTNLEKFYPKTIQKYIL
jgi:hypothetical protein